MLLLGFALIYGQLPKDQLVLQGVVGSTAGGFAGVGAFAAAFGLRIRTLRPFGFRPVPPRWLVTAVGLGLVGYGLNLIIQFTYSKRLVTPPAKPPCGLAGIAARR